MKYSELALVYLGGSAFLLYVVMFLVVGFSKPITGQRQTQTDYQINVHMDTIWFYDGSRLVGKVLNKWNSQLDSLILKDNN